eukprot:TRINITY_DN1789_c0_g2_i5.p1 TRINITY_DN1789_c0_g2~~TRINITY_DN1789_c0_g2_i5.p1  ORF type:complete len:387 (-),score=15.56 TRINITY_DN1789_c0_g2_i5:57-1217(-)
MGVGVERVRARRGFPEPPMSGDDSMPLLGHRVHHPESQLEQCDENSLRRIVSFLDAASLGRTTRVNSRFHTLCEEPHLWRRLAALDYPALPATDHPRLYYRDYYQPYVRRQEVLSQKSAWLHEWSGMCGSITLAFAMMMAFVLSILISVWLDNDIDMNVNVFFIPLWIFSLATLLGLHSCKTSIRRIQYKPFTPAQESRMLMYMGVLCCLVPLSVLWLQLRLTILSIHWHLVFLPLYLLFVLAMAGLAWLMVVTECERETYIWILIVFLIQLTLFLLGHKLQYQSLSLTQVFIPLYVIVVGSFPYALKLGRELNEDSRLLAFFLFVIWGSVVATLVLFAGYFDSRLIGEISYAFIPYWVAMSFPTFWACFICVYIWNSRTSQEYDD